MDVFIAVTVCQMTLFYCHNGIHTKLQSFRHNRYPVLVPDAADLRQNNGLQWTLMGFTTQVELVMMR